MNPRFHLLGLQAGERFRLTSGPADQIYEVVDIPEREKEPRLAIRAPDGQIVAMREIMFRNNGSFFVDLIPRSESCEKPSN